MRRWARYVLRFCFTLAMAAGLYGLIRYPVSFGPSLYVSEILPLSRGVTAQAVPQRRMPSAAALHPVAEPPAEEERAPAVAGDILPLMYHHLTENTAETSDWTTTPDKFREDLTKLLSAGYRPLSVEDYTAGRYDRGQDYFVVTFDDGYDSNRVLALPILTEMEIPATVFVITNTMGENGHMSWDQVRELTASGIVTVYSHTESHISAAENTEEVFLADARTAWEKIAANTEPALQVLAYPYGAYTRQTMEALAAEGYDLFVIQDRPWWYEEDNGAGIRILVRHNVEYTADLAKIIERSRKNAGLPTVEEAAELRAARAAEDEAARLAQYEAWIAYGKAAAEAESGRPRKK